MSSSRWSSAKRAWSTREGRSSSACLDGRWRDACRSAADGDYVDAADRLASIGEVPLQMQLRMLAARSLTDSGRPAEAGAQLELARAFYRTVGATAFLAEADGIVATAS